MTHENRQLIESLLAWGVIGLLYLLRNTHPLFKGIWNVLRLFFIVLIATLTVNYAKDKLKEWWTK